MDRADDEMVVAVEDETAKMGFFTRIISIFASPVALMKNIRHYPVIGPVLLLVMALSLLTIPTLAKITEITQSELSAVSLERYGYDITALTQAGADEETAQSVQVYTTVVSVVTLIVTYPIMILLYAIGLTVLTKIARGKATFAQYFSMFTHTKLIIAVLAVFTAFMMVNLGSVLDVTSLAAAFMPRGNMTNLTFCFLMSVNLAGVWEAALTAVGVREFNGFSATKSVVIAVIVFAVSVAINGFLMGSSFIFLDIADNALQGL